jgi:hypothetical protein
MTITSCSGAVMDGSSRKQILLAGFIGFAMGALVVWLTPLLLSSRVSSGRSNLTIEPKHFGVSYSTAALFSDIPPPDITSLTGRYKFVDASDSSGAIRLGYVIDLAMKQVDFSTIPQEYMKETPTEINGHAATKPPY